MLKISIIIDIPGSSSSRSIAFSVGRLDKTKVA